jgi:hypothetical protein
MTRPPGLGPHARHRAFGTPGPTGYNDHGDPGHRRRQGGTPGPSGHNDHGTPLSGKTFARELHDDDVARTINDIIDHVNRDSHSRRLEERLQLCLDLAKRTRVEQGEDDQKSRDVEWYFRGRLHALSGGVDASEPFADDGAAWAGDIFNQGWVWAGNMPSEATHPSRHRLGQWAPHVGRQPLQGPHESAVHWAVNGAADRLRDALGEGDLSAHLRPLTTDRNTVAFPRTLTD